MIKSRWTYSWFRMFDRMLFLLILLLVSCGQRKAEDPQQITLYHYQIWISALDSVDLMDSATLYVESKRTGMRTDYFFKNISDTDSSALFTYALHGDSLFFDDKYCRVVDTVDFDFTGKKVMLYISDYDDPDSSDEEALLFWNKQYGLLGMYNDSMGPLLLFDNQEIPGFSRQTLYRYVVDRERTRHYGRSIRVKLVDSLPN